MRDLAILTAIWVGMFLALTRAASYSTLWAAVGASALTSCIGIYVFWLDWSSPMQ